MSHGAEPAARIAVRLTPRGGRDALDGWSLDGDGRPFLRARVSAPPVEGAANAALIALLADAMRVPRRDVRLVAGDRGRLKQVAIAGLAQADAERALGRPGPTRAAASTSRPTVATLGS